MNKDTDINQVVRMLESGGVIVYPTDTVYGLGADATNPEAVALVRGIKGRGDDKPILVMVRDIAMLEKYAELTPTARTLAEKFLPGPIALILSVRNGSLSPVAGPDGAVGFRIPNHPICRALTRAFDKPITSTSVNMSGVPQARTVPAMLAQLGDSAHDIATVIDEGELPLSPPSTILDVRGDKAILVREGAVPVSALHGFLV